MVYKDLCKYKILEDSIYHGIIPKVFIKRYRWCQHPAPNLINHALLKASLTGNIHILRYVGYIMHYVNIKNVRQSHISLYYHSRCTPVFLSSISLHLLCTTSATWMFTHMHLYMYISIYKTIMAMRFTWISCLLMLQLPASKLSVVFSQHIWKPVILKGCRRLWARPH